MRLFLDSGATLKQHTEALSRPLEYLDEFKKVLAAGADLGPAIKGRVLAALWIAGLRREMDSLFETEGLLQPADVLKAVRLLDAGREARQLERKLAKLAAVQGRVRKGTVKRLKDRLNELRQDDFTREEGSATRAFLQTRVRKWIRAIPRARLEFFLMNFSTEPWKGLCDLVHTRPDDFQLPYFQSVVFGGEAPADSVVSAVLGLNPTNVTAALTAHPELFECYSVIRKKVPTLPVPAKQLLARSMPMEEVLWFYEELMSDAADKEVAGRLARGEGLESMQGRSNYGKLMERLLLFRRLGCSFAPQLMGLADERLAELENVRESLGLQGMQCAVLGDASGSMQVAVKTATILGSLLSVLLKADLRFFHNEDFRHRDTPPRTCEEVLHTAEAVQANGGTTPAASLWPYLQAGRKVDLFVVVTDEGENGRCHNMMFAEMFRTYLDTVNPQAKIFFVSFLRPGDAGTMVQRLQRVGVEATQFRMDGQRPDLSKFDQLLAKVALCVRPETSQHSDPDATMD